MHIRRRGPRVRKARRIFLWAFLAVQALFVLWIVLGIATTHTAPTSAQLAQGCYNGNWSPLFSSQADCVTHYGGALNDAGTAGKAIGAGLVVLFWVIVDIILGISRFVVVSSRRHSARTREPLDPRMMP